MIKPNKTKHSFRTSESCVFLKSLKKVKYKTLKLIFPFALIIGAYILYKTGIGCVWKSITGLPCPGCGMTRAVFALLRGDVLLSLKRHFMLFSLPIIYMYIVFDGRLFKNRKINIAVLALILFGFLARWVLALTGVLRV